MHGTIPFPTPTIPARGIDMGPGRRRVTQQDVDLFRALVGGPPTAPETPSPIDDPGHASTDPARQFKSSLVHALRLDRESRTAHLDATRRLTRALALQLVDCYNGMAVRVGRREVGEIGGDLGGWVRRTPWAWGTEFTTPKPAS